MVTATHGPPGSACPTACVSPFGEQVGERRRRAAARGCAPRQADRGGGGRERRRVRRRRTTSAAGASAVRLAMPSCSGVIHTLRSSAARRWRASSGFGVHALPHRPSSQPELVQAAASALAAETPSSNAAHASGLFERERCCLLRRGRRRSVRAPAPDRGTPPTPADTVPGACRRGRRGCGPSSPTSRAAPRDPQPRRAPRCHGARARTALTVRSRGSRQAGSRVGSGPTHGSGQAAASAQQGRRSLRTVPRPASGRGSSHPRARERPPYAPRRSSRAARSLPTAGPRRARSTVSTRPRNRMRIIVPRHPARGPRSTKCSYRQTTSGLRHSKS